MKEALNMRVLAIIILIIGATVMGCPSTESAGDNAIATIPAHWPVPPSIIPAGSTKAKLPEKWDDQTDDGYIVDGKSMFTPVKEYVISFKCDLSYEEVEKHIGGILLDDGFGGPSTFIGADAALWGKKLPDDQHMSLLVGGSQSSDEYIVQIRAGDSVYFISSDK